MGSQNSKFLSQQELPHQYRPLKQLPNVYESVLNGSRFQKHKLELNSEADIKYEKQIFIFRRMHADYLISAHFFQKFTPSHFCNLSYEVCFFTQYPMYGFSIDLILPIVKTFQVLLDCLRGFQLLFNNFGAFNVSSKNIFFDINQKPRVWISSNAGKTRVQNMNYYYKQQKMIIDIFKLFDQIKDQRNIKVTFSNYLSKIQQKPNSLTFKNVILYLVNQASKFFVNRTISKQKQKNLMSSNDSSLINNLTYRSPQYKQNNSQVISLKTRNTNRNSCDSVGNKDPVYFNYNKSNEFERITHNERTKKSKRHNSQQECKSRELNLFKLNNVVFNGDQIIILSKPQGHHRYLQPNTSRIPRKQYNYSQTFQQKPQKIKIEKTTAKLILNQAHKNVQHFKNLNQKQTYKIVETQIKSHNICKINPNYKSKNVKFVKHQQRNIIQNNNKAENIFESNKQNTVTIPASQDFNESQFILSNLQTFKSIVNSQYSDMDSEIREDLQNYHF